jgi:hypothetical protein
MINGLTQQTWFCVHSATAASSAFLELQQISKTRKIYHEVLQITAVALLTFNNEKPRSRDEQEVQLVPRKYKSTRQSVKYKHKNSSHYDELCSRSCGHIYDHLWSSDKDIIEKINITVTECTKWYKNMSCTR